MAKPDFDFKRQSSFEIGNIKIKVLHTPGHQWKVPVLLIDADGNDHAIFLVTPYF
jgi:glyoxylase-like metal-dependent hydrolase (beta-lactamase superfamily II)